MRANRAVPQKAKSSPPDTDYSLLPSDKVVEDFQANVSTGLSSPEAALRLEQYGPNQLRVSEGQPGWLRFIHQFADPLVYLLLVAVGISVLAWALEGATGLPIDAIVILVIVLANAILGFAQENKAADAVAALGAMTASHATVLRDERLTDVGALDVVPGDILVLAEGDTVAADARLVSASALRIQESSLTGESEAVPKDPQTLASPSPLGDRTDMVFKGTGVTRGVGRAVVIGTGMNTEVGRIATLLDETERALSPLQLQIAKISKALGLAVILIAIVVMGAVALTSGVHSAEEAVNILLMGVSLAVAAVPEGLPAILSLVLAVGVQAMAKRNAVMKNLDSVETLGSVSVICSDKTGTLTKNEMTLREIVTASGRVALSGTGYEPLGTASLQTKDNLGEESLDEGDPRTEDSTRNGDHHGDHTPESPAWQEARLALVGGALASNAQLDQVDGHWQIQGDPTEAAFLVGLPKLFGREERPPTDAFTRLAEAPFDSTRKLMSVLVAENGAAHKAEPGAIKEAAGTVFTKGAPDVLLERCVAEQVGNDVRKLNSRRKEELLAQVVELSGEGYRTLGVAYRPATGADNEGLDEDSEHDLIFIGTVGIIDPARKEAADAIRQAHRAGVETVMITGDHPVTAARIASDLGITAGKDDAAVTGSALDQMDDAALAQTVQRARVYARVSPENKLQIITALQKDRKIVAMTGDGVNDAPAVKAADIGIAMGITGTEVTKEAADMILGDDNYATIVFAVERGRAIFDNIKKFIRYLLSSNMGEVATVFFGVVFSGVIGLSDPANPGVAVLPLLATQILWINLVTDSGPALAMGVDPEIEDVMAKPPRGIDDVIIDRSMWARIIGIGLVMGILSIFVLDLTLPGGIVSGMETLVSTDQQLDVARTTMFTALVFMQLFNALNSRSENLSAFSHLFTNRWLWISFAFVIAAQILVVYVPALQSAFSTAPMTAAHWALAIGAGAAVLLFEEVVKLFKRAR